MQKKTIPRVLHHGRQAAYQHFHVSEQLQAQTELQDTVSHALVLTTPHPQYSPHSDAATPADCSPRMTKQFHSEPTTQSGSHDHFDCRLSPAADTEPRSVPSGSQFQAHQNISRFPRAEDISM